MVGTIFDAIMGATGSVDPMDEARAYQKQQTARNNAAIGLDPNGNPLPAPTVGGAAPGPGQVGGPPAPGEPNATKTPQDMGSIILDMTQRNAASQLFNQSLGMGLAAMAQPRDREMVSKMFNVQQPDAATIGKTLMDVNSQQQGQDRMDALGAQIMDKTQGPLLAQKLNMPGGWEALKAAYRSNPQLVGQMIQTATTPTPAMANLDQITRYMQNLPQGKYNQEQLAAIQKAMMAQASGPQAEKMIEDQNTFTTKFGHPPDWANNYTLYQEEQAKGAERLKASGDLTGTMRITENLRNDLETLKTMPGLQSILNDPNKRAAATIALNKAKTQAMDWEAFAANNSLNNQEKSAMAILARINGQQTEQAMKDMAGTGTRVTQQEVGPLQNSISTTANLNQDYGGYIHGAINPLITQTKRVGAAAWGSTGNLTGMNPEYAPWMSPVFKKGGSLYNEGGGTESIPEPKPITQAQITAAKEAAAVHPEDRTEILDELQQDGVDVSRLRTLPASKW